MSNMAGVVAGVRESVGALLRIRKAADQSKAPPGEFQVERVVVGTAWCVVSNRYLVTAHHVFNSGGPRDLNDRFFAFFVPGNGAAIYHTPITSFPVENSAADLAVVEIEPRPGFPANVTALPITYSKPHDGERVLTYGFPAPVVTTAIIDNQLNWRGGSWSSKATPTRGLSRRNTIQTATGHMSSTSRGTTARAAVRSFTPIPER